MPGLQQLAWLSARGSHAAVAVSEVTETQGRLGVGVARRHDPGDRDGHVRAQHQCRPALVEEPVGGLGFGHVGARQDRLILECRRVDLAVAVALEDPPQGVGDRARLARLIWEHVTRAAGYGVDHRTPRLRVDRLRGHALDARPKVPEALIDALIAAVDLADVADLAASVGAEGCQQHGHSGPDVRRLDPLAT